MDVLLNDAGSLSVLSGVDDDVLDFGEILGNLDALSSICVLTWLDDPNILRSSQRLIVLWLIAGLLRLLSWTWLQSSIIFIFGFLSMLALVLSSLPLHDLLILYIFFTLGVVCLKPLKFRIVKSILNMECQWQVGEDILLKCLIVILHIEIQSLLVVHVKVVLDLVVQLLFRKPGSSDIS